MKKYGKSLIFLFALPIISLIFFYFAPSWRESALHSDIITAIRKSTELSPEQKLKEEEYFSSVNFEAVCSSTDAEARKFVSDMDIQSVCNDFEIFDAAAAVSAFTLMISALFCLLILRLSRSSIAEGEYNGALILRNYRLGWMGSLIVVFISLICQGALSVALAFYATVLPTNNYYPKLVGALAICAVWGLFVTIRTLFKKIPLEFKEVAAQSVSAEEAPHLWDFVKTIAAKVGTAAPHEIVLGMQPMFYVTELSVIHSAGRSEGRVLYLSLPLMKMLNSDQLASIIGHEMGHFKGEDTLLTRQLYPLKQKTFLTAMSVEQAGLVGLPAIHMLNLFFSSFEPILMKVSRDREFLADKVGAAISSEKDSGHALIRAIYYGHVWGLAYQQSLQEGKAIDGYYEKVKSELSGKEEFWKSLSTEAQAHPLDTHPQLKARLEKLGVQTSLEFIKEVAEAMTVGDSSYQQLLGEESAKIITKAAAEEYEKLSSEQSARVQVLNAKTDEAEGRRLLEKTFPTVVYEKNITMKILSFLFLGALAIVPLIISAYDFENIKTLGICLPISLLGFYFMWNYMTYHMTAKLTLKYDSISYDLWSSPLPFERIERMNVMTNNGVSTLNMYLKEKIQNPVRGFRIFKKTKSLSIPITSFRGSDNIMINKIYSYYTRQI